MYRNALKELTKWYQSSERQPLVVRGARQVGKTWLVREFAKKNQRTLLECNFEKNPELISFFETNDPSIIFRDLSSFLRLTEKPDKALLFLDEIQAQPKLLAKLRWFAEDMPDLAVIAAGSLLDFVLAEHEFSMPVGRIRYLHLEPLSFEEFLLAQDHAHYVEFLEKIEVNHTIPAAMHNKLLDEFRTFMFVGGMPKAVSEWARYGEISQVNRIHQSIIQTYQDDFSKYAKRLPLQHLLDIMAAIPMQLGRKFKFSAANPNVQTAPLKKAVKLLTLSRVCHQIFSARAHGLPLAADIKQNVFKLIYLDIGLLVNALGIYGIKDITLNNEGPLAEQVVGQLLRTLSPFYMEPKLYYWTREKKGSAAEVDYIYTAGKKIIPLEVKAGTTGTLKSLHWLMADRQWPLATRISQLPLSEVNVKTKAPNGVTNYTLLSLPFYLIEQLPRLVANGAARS